MKYARLLSVVATAVLGCGGAYAILSSNAPTWLVALSGILAVGGAAAMGTLGLLVWVTIVEDIRPSLRFRKPVVPLALSHREASLIGETRMRNHPVRFWGGLSINNRFFIGFIVFDQPEHLTFKDSPQ